MGILGMKSMAGGLILGSKTVTPVECLHYAMNLPTSVVITGCDSMKILQQALYAARSFKPISGSEVASLLAKTAQAAGKGFHGDGKTDRAAGQGEWRDQCASQDRQRGRDRHGVRAHGGDIDA